MLKTMTVVQLAAQIHRVIGRLEISEWRVTVEHTPSQVAPIGPTDPTGYQQNWSVIRSRPDVVLGGLAYTWATNGPEELDRVFGLVDGSGVPTDGSAAASARRLSRVRKLDATLGQPLQLSVIEKLL